VAVFRLLPLRLAERVFPGELLTVVDTDLPVVVGLADLPVVVGLADLPVVVGLADLPVVVDMVARLAASADLLVAARLPVDSVALLVAARLPVDSVALLAGVTAAMAVLLVAAALLVDSAVLRQVVLPDGNADQTAGWGKPRRKRVLAEGAAAEPLRDPPATVCGRLGPRT